MRKGVIDYFSDKCDIYIYLYNIYIYDKNYK